MHQLYLIHRVEKTDTKKLGRLMDHGMLFLHNNYSPDKRGYVTEKSSGWIDFNFLKLFVGI